MKKYILIIVFINKMNDYSKKYFYQSTSFYKNNKDNFINSLNMMLHFNEVSEDNKNTIYYKNIKSKNNSPYIFRKYNQLMNKYGKDSSYFSNMIIESMDKYLNDFSQIIRFGTLIEYNVKDDIVFYLIKLPKGLNIYHSSRKLNLNHSKYNIMYKYFDEPFLYPDYNEPDAKPSLNSFYSDLKSAMNYNFINASQKDYEKLIKIYRNEKYDDNMIKPIEGINAFILSDDIHLILYQFDWINYFPYSIMSDLSLSPSFKKILVDIFDFSYINLKSIYINFSNIFTPFDKENYDKVFGICNMFETYLFENDDQNNYDFLFEFINKSFNKSFIKYENISTKTTWNLYKYKKGIVPIFEIYDDLFHEINKNNQIFSDVLTFLQMHQNNESIENIKIYYDKIIEYINISVLSKYRGYRVSFYEYDYHIMNKMSYIIKDLFFINSNNKSIKDNKIYGYIATGIYQFFAEDTFQQEMFFYDPTLKNKNNIQLIERFHDNPYDNNYGINSDEMIQEYRKYLTTNLLTEDEFGDVVGFHEGHLLEHSVWSGQYSIFLINYIINNYKNYRIPFDLVRKYLDMNNPIYIMLIYITAFYHDIGKLGDCNFKYYDFINRDTLKLEYQECNVEKNQNFLYNTLSSHPEKSYEYLTNRRPFRFSNYDMEFPDDKYYSKNIKEYFLKIFEKYLTIDMYDIFTIAVSCHWFFGDILLRNVNEIKNKDYSSINRYLEKILFYVYNYDKVNDKDVFIFIIFLTIIISIADILASHNFEYDEPSGIDKNSMIGSIFQSLPEKYKEIHYQFNKKLESNTEYIIPFEETILNDSYINILNNCMYLLGVVLKYVNENEIKFNPKNNYRDYYDLMDNIEKYKDHFPNVIFIDVNILYFIYQKYNKNLKTFFNKISPLFSVKYVAYGKLQNKYENKFIDSINSEKILNITNDMFFDDDPNYYLDPLNIFYDNNPFTERILIYRDNLNIELEFNEKLVQQVIFYTDDENFINNFIKGIYLSVWNFYTNN